MNLIGDPAAINRIAVKLDEKAEQLASVGRRVQERTDRSRGRWECLKADRFRSTMAGRRQQADNMAHDLHELARQLRIVASSVQTRLNNLNALERRVRSTLAAAEHGAEWALQRGVDITRLPAPTDPAWESIARKLRA